MNRILKNIGMTVAIPVLTYIFFLIMCNLFGSPGFGVGNDLTTIIYTTLYTSMIALAMSYNLTCGRFDYSVGATILLSVIVGGNIVKDYKLGPIPMLIILVLIAAICGLISGIAYATLKLPPMVVSIGITMIYEAIGLSVNSGKGVKVIGNSSLIYASLPYSAIVVGIAILILIYLYNFTSFGYQWRMLRS